MIAAALLGSVLASAALAAGFLWTECAAPVGHLATVNGLAVNDGTALPATTTQLVSVVATAHRGGGLTGDQAGADAELAAVELWLWHDANGNGRSDAGDDDANPAGWTLVSETCTAVGWDDQAQGLDAGAPAELLAAPVDLPGAAPNQRYLVLLRVVAAGTGYTNLMPTNGNGTVSGGWAGEPGESTFVGPGETWTATGAGACGVTGDGGLPGVGDGEVWYFRIGAGGEVGPAFPMPPKVIENP